MKSYDLLLKWKQSRTLAFLQVHQIENIVSSVTSECFFFVSDIILTWLIWYSHHCSACLRGFSNNFTGAMNEINILWPILSFFSNGITQTDIYVPLSSRIALSKTSHSNEWFTLGLVASSNCISFIKWCFRPYIRIYVFGIQM